MKPQLRLPMLLLAALVAALAVVGCGGGGKADLSATEVVSQTFGKDAAIKSGRLTLALDANVKGAASTSGPVALKLSGPFEAAKDDGNLPKFAFDLTVASGGQTITAGAVSTGDKGFLRFQGTSYAVPAELFKQFKDSYVKSQQQAQAQRKDQPTLQSLGIDPRAWLTDPKKQPDAEVGGVSTYHVTTGIDVPKLLADVQTTLAKAGSVSKGAQQLSQADRDQLQKAVKSAKVDLYSGKDDKRLRKLVLDLQLTTGTVRFTLGLDQLDQPQTITAPKATRPLSDLVAQFQGAGQPAPSAGSGGAATRGANQKYLDCLQSAGQDLAKVQACAKYL